MSRDKNLGGKVLKNGWITFQGVNKVGQSSLSMDCGGDTDMISFSVKDSLMKYIDPDMNYAFRGVKFNPAVNKELMKYKSQNGKVSRFKKNDDNDYQFYASGDLLNLYLSVLSSSLNSQEISHIYYPLAKKDWSAHMPGFMSWPNVFVFPASKKDEFTNLSSSVNSQYEKIKEIDGPQFYHLAKIDILIDAGIKPFTLDEDVSFEANGTLVQKMSNLLHTYRAKHSLNSSYTDD